MVKNMPKILVVDDELDILEIIRHALNKEGFEVHIAANGFQALEQTRKIKPDLILMDVMMPVMDGMEACRQLKEDNDTKNIPIVFLTARSEEFAELAGFEAGADDYISKPIRPRVLMSRLKAILRRRNAIQSTTHEIIDFGDLKIDRERFVVEFKGKSLQFPRKEFELLSFLASRPGRVFSRDEILENVWGNEVLVVDRTIDVHVRKIREKLEERYIYTVKGVGYKFEAS
ncbi:MAG: response regulator transcription factor [Sphingomonadales bacterium]|nr:response regulator transcription factor [Sphingomonadales bacterium]